ncbi:MAG: hypothetical protein ACKVS8_03385 [Phycisphaerales bacterium]
MFTRTVLAFALAGGIASVASAGQIFISNIGGGITMNSGPLSGMAFTNSQTNWTDLSLSNVHASLNANGLATANKITILTADTDHGLALIALMDRQMAAEGVFASGNVHMDSIANGDNLAYINSGGSVSIGMNTADARVASGNFGWNANDGGAGFAWAGLITGNTTTFRFSRLDTLALGLDDPSTFQFANWNGASWETVAVAADLLTFSTTDGYGFSAVTLIPAPSAVMAVAPALALALVRRRRAL